MAITKAAFDRELAVLDSEIHQVLTGAVRSHDANTADRIESMKAISTQEWQNAARALLMARKASVLEAMSQSCLEAIAHGHIDLNASLHRAIDVASEHKAQRTVQEIAARRLNLCMDEHASALHSMETGLVHDALLEAYNAGATSRNA